MASRILSQEEINTAGERLKDIIITQWLSRNLNEKPNIIIKVFGVPRGGIPVAYLLADTNLVVVDEWRKAHVIVDDLCDSGTTMTKWQRLTNLPFYTLESHLTNRRREDEWLVFPWEQAEEDDTSADDIVVRLLQYIGEDPKREGLLETPKRVLKAWSHWAGGYKEDPAAILKCFKDGAENYGDNMVTVKNIPFYSMCEHHLAPFFGTATISYIPDGKVVGLSKLSRLLGIYAKRLQVQERLTSQVAEALHTNLGPVGVGVQLKARHMCMESRGIQQQGSETITTALRGDFMSDHKVRAEFLSQA